MIPAGRSILWGGYPPAESILILSVLASLSYQPFLSYRIGIYPICRRSRKWTDRFGRQAIPPFGVTYKWDSGQSGSILILSSLPYHNYPLSKKGRNLYHLVGVSYEVDTSQEEYGGILPTLNYLSFAQPSQPSRSILPNRTSNMEHPIGVVTEGRSL